MSETIEPSLRDFLMSYDHSNDRDVRFIPKDKALGGTNAYLTYAEMKELCVNVGDAAALLMTYYFRKVKTPKFDFYDDNAIGLALGWSSSKAKKNRLALAREGWINRATFVQPTSKAKITVFYIGKEQCDLVKNVTKGEDTEPSTFEVDAVMNQEIAMYFGLKDFDEVLRVKNINEIKEAYFLLK